MEQQKLRELLDTLHQELEQVDSIDETHGSCSVEPQVGYAETA